MAEDYLVRGLALSGAVRLFAARTTALVEELRRRHDAWPTATAALGRTVTVAAMMGAMLKGNEKLTLQVKGDGPLGQIVADANADGEVRGYVDHPHVHLPLNDLGKLDVGGAVGKGTIYVLKDLGINEPYRGSVPIVSGEIGDDFTAYFAASEQTPSVVGAGVLVNPDNSVQASGGLILQLMPGVDDDTIDEIEHRVQQLPQISTMINEGLSPEEMLEKIFPGRLSLIGRLPLRFSCFCSHERVESVLRSLGAEELQSMLDEDGEAEVVCHFCNEKYHFNRDDLEALIQQLNDAN